MIESTGIARWNPWIRLSNPQGIQLRFRSESDLNPRFSALESLWNPMILAGIAIESIRITFKRRNGWIPFLKLIGFYSYDEAQVRSSRILVLNPKIQK